MTANGFLQSLIFLILVLGLARPLGLYMAAVLDGRSTWLSPALIPVERLLYRMAGIQPEQGQSWRAYGVAALTFNLLGLALVYLFLRLQHLLPLNPSGFGPVAPLTAMNIAVSFATNTNWQNYGGETTLSYLSQMVALTTQNFLSAATGIAVMAALARGFARARTRDLGNFWADLVRSTLYVLLPLSVLLAVFLVSQGVVQTLSSYAQATTLAGTEQTLALGPAASQVAIKQLGTNGGGFFNVNSAHPLENPTPLSNLAQMVAILLIPAALCVTFGRMIRDERQGWLLLSVMTLVLVAALAGVMLAEQRGNPAFERLGISAAAMDSKGPDALAQSQSGGNMEGKETRFGVVNSAIWAVSTTAASNGSVNSMHDSFSPLGGMIVLWLIQLGEIIFGGVGSGLYGMVLYALVAVFLAGLMVGRTPEYLGKKIGPYEMKMASLAILIPPLVILGFTALAVSLPLGLAGRSNPGPHGFTQILYCLSSTGNNNGSAFGGYSSDNALINILGALAMLAGRYWVMLPVLAIAGSLAAKKAIPVTQGTLPTHTPLFAILLTLTILAVGALTFLPALALGPIVEHLILIEGIR